MPELITVSLCVGGLVVVVGAVLLFTAVRIVPEYQRLVVLRLGRVIGPKGPGLVLLIPIVDRPIMVDLREQIAKSRIRSRSPKTTRRSRLTSCGTTKCSIPS
ncbi:MAG: hypothetical protein HW418_3377 [Anaerolineales bacterium]|nr:hypothetical protein [Anaerolineales bacterium]